jgi:hypothetical protein
LYFRSASCNSNLIYPVPGEGGVSGLRRGLVQLALGDDHCHPVPLPQGQHNAVGRRLVSARVRPRVTDITSVERQGELEPVLRRRHTRPAEDKSAGRRALEVSVVRVETVADVCDHILEPDLRRGGQGVGGGAGGGECNGGAGIRYKSRGVIVITVAWVETTISCSLSHFDIFVVVLCIFYILGLSSTTREKSLSRTTGFAIGARRRISPRAATRIRAGS